MTARQRSPGIWTVIRGLASVACGKVNAIYRLKRKHASTKMTKLGKRKINGGSHAASLRSHMWTQNRKPSPGADRHSDVMLGLR